MSCNHVGTVCLGFFMVVALRFGRLGDEEGDDAGLALVNLFLLFLSFPSFSSSSLANSRVRLTVGSGLKSGCEVGSLARSYTSLGRL
jgi:hypothetical protein